MCFSAEASFTAAALLIPLGGLAVVRAAKVAPKYAPLCALPLLFGLQQAMEGMVWIAGGGDDAAWVERFSLAYMFFSWIAWPVWVPVSVYFLEPLRRRPLYIAFAVGGAMLGGVQYIPYFTHEGWLTTTFLANAISYGDTQLLDALMTREATYLLYLVFIIMPLIVSSDRAARVFGALVTLVLAITYFFFSFAYISVFCMGGAVMSSYLVWMIFRKGADTPPRLVAPA